MAKRNLRVAVKSSDIVVGTSVHAPLSVQAPNNRAAETAQALQEALSIGSTAAADFFGQKFDETAAIAAAEKATGKERDTLNAAIGYNTMWDRVDAEDDFNLFKLEFEEILRGKDAENMEEIDVQNLFNEKASKAFNAAEQSPAYLAELAPRMFAYNQEFIETHRLGIIQNTKNEQGAKLNRNITQRFDDTGTFDYDYLAEVTNDLFERKERTVAYETTLVNFAINNGMPGIIENAPAKFPGGQPTPLSFGEGLTRARKAITQAENVRKARETAAIKAAEDARKAGDNLAMIHAVNAMSSGDPEAEKLVWAFGQRPGASAKDYIQLISAFRSTRDDVQRQAADEDELAALTTSVYVGTSRIGDIMQSYVDGTFGNGLEAIKRMNALMSTANRVAGQEGQIQQIHRTHIDDIKARYNPSRNGILGKLDQRRAQLQANALLDYRTAVFDNNEDPETAWTRVREQGDATLARFKETQVIGDPDDTASLPEIANLWLSNEMSDSRMRSFGYSVDQIESMGLPPEDELRLLGIIF